jgi:hypothetical protein
MNKRLQKALQLLLQGQDRDSVNEFFTNALCDEDGDQFCQADLQRGTANIFDSETGEEVKTVKFAISIEEME